MDPLGASNEAASLAHALEHAGHLMPAQGPLSVFIHHNTLHAFEHLPFHEAVTTASRLYETEPYFTEARFRDLYAAGRITDADLDGVLERWWQATPPPPVGPFAVRSLHRMAVLLIAVMLAGVFPGPILSWARRDVHSSGHVEAARPASSRG